MAPDNSGSDENREKKDPWANNKYITKSGEKYLIKFDGKSYGPYARSKNSKSQNQKINLQPLWFKLYLSNAEGKKMEEGDK